MSSATAIAGGLSRLEPRRSDQHPGWFARARQAAFGWVTEHGFPTPKDEDWKYSRLAPILHGQFEPAAVGTGHRLSVGAIDELAGDLGGMRLVFVNGHFARELSSATDLADGLEVTNLASLLVEEPGRLEPLMSSLQPSYPHAFVALNAALAEDGAFIYLPADTAVDVPIHLVFVSDTGGTPLVSSPRSFVLAGPGSQATIVETYAGRASDVHVTNAVTEVLLEEGASVEHYKVQDEVESSFHLGLLKVRQARTSKFSSSSVALGSSIARHEIRVSLDAEGAKVNLDGLYLPTRDQYHDNPILVEHNAPRCTSRQLYKGVLDGRGQGVFNGRIVVRPGAMGTDAGQSNKNLLLSDHAEVDTRPRFEILADDVK
ncbi:MAG: SufB/SufD family protein, partial [Acidimicrobiia bacterium]